MYYSCESSSPAPSHTRPVIVLLHYRIVSGVVLPQSRHRSQVCGERLTWHINCSLPRWIELAREQMRGAVTWHHFWQTPYIPHHLSLFLSLFTVPAAASSDVLLALPKMTCVHACVFVCVCAWKHIRVIVYFITACSLRLLFRISITYQTYLKITFRFRVLIELVSGVISTTGKRSIKFTKMTSLCIYWCYVSL